MYQFSPSLIKPPRWNIQPHLTAAPELWAANPVVVLPYWEDGRLTDISGYGNHAERVNSPSFHPISTGPAYDYDGSTQYADAGGDITGLGGAKQLSVITEVVLDNTLEDGALIRKWRGGSQAFFLAQSSNTGVFRFLINDNSQNNILSVETSNSVLSNNGVVHRIGAVWRGGSTMDLYLDGQKLDVTTNSTATPSEVADVSEHLSFMARYNGGFVDQHTTGRQSFVYIAPTELTDETMLRATSDPFAMLRPGPQLLPLLFGGAGATGSTVTDTALITSAIASPLTATDAATATDTATITSTAASLLTATETAVASDTAQITAASATPLTATATASATDTAQITNATATTLTASETTSAAVTDTAVITSADATSLTAVETAIANDTAFITNAIVATLVANENTGTLVSATSTAQLTLPAPGSLTITPQGALAYITPNAGSRLVTPNAPGSQSVTPDTPGSTTVTPRAD